MLVHVVSNGRSVFGFPDPGSAITASGRQTLSKTKFGGPVIIGLCLGEWRAARVFSARRLTLLLEFPIFQTRAVLHHHRAYAEFKIWRQFRIRVGLGKAAKAANAKGKCQSAVQL